MWEAVEPFTLPSGYSTLVIQRMIVDSVEADHFVCHTYDGTTEGTVDVLVANPNGVDRAEDDELWALFTPDGGTGVEDAPQWLDLELGVAGGSGAVHNCRAATTGNITLSGSQTVDGQSPTNGDKILVWQQSTASENGVYTYNGSGAWTKVTGFDAGADMLVFVRAGATYGLTAFGVTAVNTVSGLGGYFV